MNSLNKPMTNIAHIETLDNNTKAIAFYEWGIAGDEYFGIAVLKKNIWGTDILYGEILDSKMERVLVKTNSGKQFEANIVEYNNGERLWFVITEGEPLIDVTITGYSRNGIIMESF